MAKNSGLNNSLAYAYAKNVIRPTIMTALADSFGKNATLSEFKPRNSSKPTAYPPVWITVTEGAKNFNIACLGHQSVTEYVALSTFVFEFAPDLAFIHNNKVYYIKNSAIQGKLDKLIVNPRMVKNAQGIDSTIVNVSADKLAEFASVTVDLTDTEVGAKFTKMTAEFNKG